jgi:phosphoesterase RecJ-like protein
MTKIVTDAAPKILDAIKASKSILLHCHPSPDPDSVGSALATKFALEGMGKKATVIRGDSEIPDAFMHFPGAGDIVKKNFFELDLTQFDLFIVQDTGGIDRISRLGEMKIPASLPTIVIDHHISNPGFGTLVNIVDSTYPATALILFDLFKLWKIEITPEMAANLFIGAYTDTGGFKYRSVTPKVFTVAAELATIYPDFAKLVETMENCRKPGELVALGLFLANIKSFLDGNLAIAIVSNSLLAENNVTEEDVATSWASSMMRSVAEWGIVCAAVETQPGQVKTSFRTRNPDKFDLAKLTSALGGGGHKSAAGANITMPLDQAIEKIVAMAQELYNL